MRRLSLDQLHTLIVVAEQGGFSAAARLLNLSQPAVSLQIRELEARLGVPLIERLGKKAYPTEAGREVIAHARRMRAEEEALLEALRRRRGWLGRVRLGAGPSFAAYLLPPALKVLRETEPDLDLEVRTGISRSSAERVIRNELDIAVVTLPMAHPLLEVTPLRSDPYLAAIPGDTPDVPDVVGPEFFAGRKLLLDGRSQMDRLFRAWLAAAGVEPQVAMEVGSPMAVRNIVAAGLGVSLIEPETALAGGVPAGSLILRPLSPRLDRITAIVRRRDKAMGPGLEIVQAALMTLANDTGPRPDPEG